MTIYVKGALWHMGENKFFRKMVNFDIKIELFWESTSPILLKCGMEVDFEGIQKSDAVIFEILIFRDFSGGQSPNFGL